MACLQYRQLKYQLAKCCYTEETAIPLKLYTKTYMYLEIVVNIKKVPQVLYKVKNDNKSKFYYNWNTKVTRYAVFTAVTIKIAISKMLLDLNKTAVPLKLYTNTFYQLLFSAFKNVTIGPDWSKKIIKIFWFTVRPWFK